MHFDLDRVRANVRRADTEDLLDRVTVYRGGMEPEAVDVIEAELRRRGVREEAIAEHAVRREAEVLLLPDGTAATCSFCHRPAVDQLGGWHRLWGVLPLFPRVFRHCAEHLPEGEQGEE